MILSFPDYQEQARRLADALDLPLRMVELHRFPDGESKVRLPTDLPERVIVCRSLNQPNDKLVELLLVAETARAMGVQHLTLVAPYLCYMRQDIAFNPGEAVSQRIVGGFLGQLFDALLTVDPHLHRIARLDEAVPDTQAVALSCAPAMGHFLRERGGRPLLVGPDGESEQWVRAIAELADLEFRVATKVRHGDHEVEIELPDYDYQGREIVLIDDMASTGRTLVTVAGLLRERGAGPLNCLITHALHGPEAESLLRDAGIEHVWSSDSIAHPSNAVMLDQLLADAVRLAG